MSLIGQILWDSLGQLPLALTVTLAVAAAVWWLYPSQVRSLRGGLRWVLPALRLMALTALAASILKPVLARPSSVEEKGAVVILVDRSKSMSVADSSRSSAERVALADGLGMLPAGLRSDVSQGALEQLDRLKSLADDVMRCQRELEFARLSGQGVGGAEQRLKQNVEQFQALAKVLAVRAKNVPKAMSEALADLGRIGDPRDSRDPRAEGGSSRGSAERGRWGSTVARKIESAAAAVARRQAMSDEQLYNSHIEVRRTCDALAKLSRYALVEEALTHPGSGLLDRFPSAVPLYGFGFAEHLAPLPLRGGGRPVQRLMLEPDGRQSDLGGAVPAALEAIRGQSVRAVIVFSDGRQVGGDESVPSGLMNLGVPVFTVAAAPERSPADLSFAALSMPTSAFVSETITVRGRLHQQGFKGETATIHLKGAGVDQTQQVKLADIGLTPVEFQVKVSQAGVQKLILSADPLPGEISIENNQLERRVKVMSEKIKIGVYAGWPSWDFQYVRNALSRTPWVTVDDAVLSGETKLSLSPQDILKLDLLILSDVDVSSLSEAQWDAVVQLVKDRGGSLILLAGDAQMPKQYAQHLLLKDLLPFRSETTPVWRSWPGEAPNFHLAPSSDAQEIDALKLSDDPAQPRWPQLSGMYHYLAIGQLKPNVQHVLLVERDTLSPVLTESRLGMGRVFFFGANETWRWRYKAGERDHDRFWLQLLRYAAEEPYAVRQGGLALDLEKVSVEPDEPLRLRARVQDPQGLPSEAAQQQVRVFQGDTLVRTEDLPATDASGGGRYAATIAGFPAGDYELELSDGEQKEPLRLPFRVAVSDEQEMADLSADHAKLRRLSEASGGELVRLEQVAHLPEKLRDLSERSGELVELRLWDSPYLFLFVLGCLAAEWALRKRFGLA